MIRLTRRFTIVLFFVTCISPWQLATPEDNKPQGPSPPDCNTVLRESDPSIAYPILLEKVPPETRDDKGEFHHGWACAEVTVKADGSVTDVKIVDSSDHVIANNFKKVLPKWRYKPAEKDGHPLQFRWNVSVNVR